MARRRYLLWSLLCILGVLLQGCASTRDVPLAKKDLESAQNIRFCRYQFPGYMKETTGSRVASAAVAAPFLIFGALGGAIGGGLYGAVSSNMMLSAGKEVQAKYNLPDFTEMIHKDLSEKLSVCFPASTKLIFEEKPLSDKPEGATDVFLTIGAFVVLSDGHGLRTNAVVVLTDPANNILWKKRYRYVSVDFDRTSDLEVLEANGGKLLREEIAHAAKLTVAEFLNDFKNGTVSPKEEAGDEEQMTP